MEGQTTFSKHRPALLVVTNTSITADWKQHIASPSIVCYSSIAPGDVGPCIDAGSKKSKKKKSGTGVPFAPGTKEAPEAVSIPGWLREEEEEDGAVLYAHTYASVHI